MTTAPVLEVRGLVKRFGGLLATDHLDLDLREGECHAVIGPNGAGKTTVINQLFGELPSDAGAVRLFGRDLAGLRPPARVRLGLGRTFQITQLLPSYTALDHVALAIQTHRGHSFRFLRSARADRRLTEPARDILIRMGLGPRMEVTVANLSHGERKQLELAIALAGGPRVLLLDEPMAGLGPVETQAMIALLAGLKGHVSMLLIEHDMEAVFALADRITVLVYGRAIASGSAAEIQANPEVRTAYLGEGDA